jgi:hypothetical protein
METPLNIGQTKTRKDAQNDIKLAYVDLTYERKLGNSR